MKDFREIENVRTGAAYIINQHGRRGGGMRPEGVPYFLFGQKGSASCLILQEKELPLFIILIF